MQEEADQYLNWWLGWRPRSQRWQLGRDCVKQTLEDDQWVDQHIRPMCRRFVGRPVAGDHQMTEEEKAIAEVLRKMRAEKRGEQQVEARGAMVRDFPEFQQALGARSFASSGLPPGPTRRRQSGGDPAEVDRGRWRQQQGAPKARPSGAGRGGKPISTFIKLS